MARKPKLTLTVVDKKGPCACHHGHKIGDSFDFDEDRGRLCPMALHVAFVYADILRYGGTPPGMKDGEVRFCCPDVDVINVFSIRPS